MCLPKQVEGVTIQRLATTIGNLLCLNFGLIFGITPAHMQLYQAADTPLNRIVDDNNAAWISGYLFLCAAIGSLVFGLISDKIGPKSVLMLSGLLQISSWFCIHFGYDIIHIHSSRMAAGIAAGGTFTVLPIYITEISEEQNRSSLLRSIDIWRTLGILLGFALGAYVDYRYVNIIGISISFVFTMTFPLVQESPYYYMRKENVTSMEKSLRWFRGIRDIDDREKPEYLSELREFMAEMKSTRGSDQKIAETPMPKTYILRLVVICLVLMMGAQFSGIYVILNFAEEVFAEIDWYITPMTEAVLILAGVQLIGAIVAACIGDKINRRILLSITAFTCGLTLITLVIYILYGSNWQLNPLQAPWLPLSLLSLHLLVANIGLYPLATTIIGEVLPLKLRTPLTSVTTAISWLLAFFLINFFYPLTAEIGLVGCLSIFAGFSIFVALFALIFMPETRDNSLEEVQQNMGYIATINVAKITNVSHGHITNGHI